MEEENLNPNPLYKDVMDYIKKPKSKLSLNKAFKRKLLLKKITPWLIIMIIVGVSIGSYQFFTKFKSTPTASVSSPEPKVVCKQFTNLQEALQDIEITCILKLEDQGLTKLSSDITKLTKLNELSLKNNKIASFPAEILNMPTLITLDLSNNQISQIPNQMVNLKSLQSLNLSGNNLTETEKNKVKKLFPNLSIVF